MDNYYYEGRQEANFPGERVVKYHRMLTTYLDTLLCNDFEFQHIIGPQPPEHMLDIESMRDKMYKPMMLLIIAIKR